ncbi:MAG: thiamine pyrophosphate-dependent dehydrogenase E1 component subunit alpha [Defluviitaleaceae bacterium]|nr:thiamine pyrophosphate-dependent dehydrogenase E1 component subunit alpha [Defluviitaleaceae bacterium]
MAGKEYPKEMIKEMYTKMLRIRLFESRAKEAFTKGEIAGNLHLAIGQEAADVGACYALKPTDFITSTHRGHGHAIAKGADSRYALAEIFGKKTGYCGGKGGSMHITDVKGLSSLGANGIVGAGIPIGAGSALASRLFGDTHVTLCMFGDGASNQGWFQEAMNMSARWKLPAVFYCQNNGYGVSTAIDRVTDVKDIATRAKGHEIPGKVVDGNDVIAVYEAVQEAVEYARAGNGPYLVEAKTFRHEGHFCGDAALYRPAEYMDTANEKDAITRTRKLMLESGITKAEIDEIDKAIAIEIEEAYKFATESAFPDHSEVLTDVYAMDNERCVVR